MESGIIWFLIVALVAGVLVLGVVSQAAPKQKGSKRSGNRRSANLDREFVARKWAAIEGMAAGQGGSLRDAVSEADKLLDYAMKGSGFRGETMGERLKNHGGRFSNINGIWSAHKVRNALAHEAEFDLVPSQAREAIAEFKRGLNDLGAL